MVMPQWLSNWYRNWIAFWWRTYWEPPSEIRNLTAFSYWSSAMVFKATLTWTNPTTRVDGSPLNSSDIQGVDVYDALGKIGTVTGGATTSFETDALTSGPHDFHLVVFDTVGHVSDNSNIATVMVPVEVAKPSAVADLSASLLGS